MKYLLISISTAQLADAGALHGRGWLPHSQKVSI